MSEPIVLKPTRWFLWRALAMLILFGVFAGMFFKDWRWGYLEANRSYYHERAVEEAAAEFLKRKTNTTEDKWRDFASRQSYVLPDDAAPVPADMATEIPWPEFTQDYQTMDEGVGNWRSTLFNPYRAEAGLKASPGEKAHSQRKIDEQFWFFALFLTLFVIVLGVMLFVLTRRMVLKGDVFKPTTGKAVRISELFRMDLTQWKRKGLAFAWAGVDGQDERKIRIDGMFYGGFDTEQGQPAEKLMNGLLDKFSGELIEEHVEDGGDESAPDGEKEGDASEAAPVDGPKAGSTES